MTSFTFLAQIKQQIQPDALVVQEAQKMLESLQNILVRSHIKAVCELGGSIAKDTHLLGDADIDIFVRFDQCYAKENISNLLEPLLQDYVYERVHGSRDYFQVTHHHLLFEIVPVIKIDHASQAYNITDASPLHVKWVLQHIKKNQHDEIRLLKKFCKAASVYGAESYIRGFSGHVIDILTLHYGSFLDVLAAAATWKPKTIIDPSQHYKHKRDVLFGLNQSKIQGPLIVIDPTNKQRNAASALGLSKFLLFQKKANQFLKNPSSDYFNEIEKGITYIKKHHKDVFIVKLKAPLGKRDVIGSKIKKQFTFVKRALKNAGFEIVQSDWYWSKKQKTLMWFSFKKNTLPPIKIITGPPLDKEEHVKAFKQKYAQTSIKDQNLVANIKVEHRDPSFYIKHTIQSSSLKLVEIIHHKA